MKTRLNRTRDKQGSVLLAAMGITFVLGLGVASYLTLMSWQHVSVVRSQAWNAAMAMAEAGVEEALAQLNPGALLFETNIDRGANGWSLLSDGTYHAPRRTLPDGYYDVAITADSPPFICATGYVTIPTLSATVSRAVRVTTGLGGVFRGGMAARVNVDLKGNNVWTDSFNSTDESASTGGLYDVAKRRAFGDVACTEGMIYVGNANIMGTLYTSPQGAIAVKQSQGSVGDVPWVLNKTSGVESGHYKNDFNMDFPAVLPPYQTGLQPTQNGTNTWLLEDGRKYMYDGSIDFHTKEIIHVTGSAVVYVTGDFTMAGSAQILIDPGATLRLYVGGANTQITTLNNGGNCATFTYFGLPGNTAVDLSGNAVFLGSVYAPSASLTLGGGGSDTQDFQGACAVNDIKLNGHFNFHFDENLRRAGPARGYQITGWTEL